MREITGLAIDLAKNVFQLHGTDEHGVVQLRKQVRRAQLLPLIAQLAPCTVMMEACGAAHYWGRQIARLGHTVRLIPPQRVKPYRIGNKNDPNDAAAISEAGERPNMRFVTVKSEEQQALMAAQRLRELLVKSRTALANHLRGELAEFGICSGRGLRALREQLHRDEVLQTLPALMGEVLRQGREHLEKLDAAIEVAYRRLEYLVKANAVCRYLMNRRGIGVLTAAALHAQIDPTQFKNARQLSAFIGLVPRQHSSGDRQVLLGISKRGNTQLRTLLIHGARAVVRTVNGKTDPLSQWIVQLKARRGVHRTIVAVANKLARYAWVDLRQARLAALD